MRPDSEYQFASDEKNLRSGAEVYLKGYKGYKSVLAQYSGASPPPRQARQLPRTIFETKKLTCMLKFRKFQK